MHWQHRLSKLKDFFHAGSPLQILANEIGQTIVAIDGLHHSRQGAVPLDHITYGATRMPILLPVTRGRSTQEHSKHDRLHQ